MKKIIELPGKAKAILRPFARMIGGFPFLGMEFFCFLLRILVKQPIGPLLALITEGVWLWWNTAKIKRFFQTINAWFAS